MIDFSARAPIAYTEIQRSYNTGRAFGAIAFVLLIVGWAIVVGDIFVLIFLVPAMAVVADALYRRTHGVSPLPGEIIGTTMIVLALMLRGPAPGIHGLSIVWIVVSTALVLPLRQAASLVLYAISMSAATFVLFYNTDLAFIGIVVGTGAEGIIDAGSAIVYVVITISLVIRVIRVGIESQDRHIEALAQERRAVELKNEFVSMVSHELRTPLTVISGFAETLSDSWTSLATDDIDEFLGMMRDESTHLTNLVEDILVIPRLEAGHLKLTVDEFDLAAEVHTVARVVLRHQSYSVVIPANIVVYTDRTRLRQILRNLLENAEKYGGDELLISGELLENGLYKVEVSDNGSGVDEQDRQRIFNHFEQLSTGDARLQQGVGLGLPIARMVSRAMGGDLWYEERFPMGARFCFSVHLLPAAQRKEASESAASTA